MAGVALAALLGALVADRTAGAQTSAPTARPGIPRVGILLPGSRPEGPSPFEQGLRQLGYVEGRTIRFEGRYADWQPERLPDLAAELVALGVDVILATNTQAAAAAKKATETIPIVMIAGSDPVVRGLVASLERPGGNVTGLALSTAEVVGKQLALVKEALPSLARVGVLWDASMGPFVPAREARLQAWALDLELIPLEVRRPTQLAAVLASATDARAGAVTVIESPMLRAQRTQLAELAVTLRVAVLAVSKEFAEAGCLLAYGPDSGALWQQAARLVGRILEGARPADIPVERPARYELVVNLRTARALRLTLPAALVGRADTVIR